MESKKKTTKKLIAVILALLMVMSILPAGLFSAFAADNFDISVVDSSDNGISNAQIKISGTDVALGSTVISETTLTSSSSGNTSLSGVISYFETNPDAQLKLDYEVSASGYRDNKDSAIITSSTAADGLKIKMQDNPKVVFDDNATVWAGSEKLTTGDTVDVNTEIKVKLKDNYKLSDDSGFTYDDSEIAYFYTVKDDVEIKTTPITYTISVEVDGNGTITPVSNINNKDVVVIDKSSEKTEITFNPKEHYHLDKFMFDTDDKTDEVINNKYAITNSDITDDTHKITATFALDTFKVSAKTVDGQETRGDVSLSGAADFDAVQYGSEVTVEFAPKSEEFALVNVTNNGTDVSEDDITFKAGSNSATYKFTVTGETEIIADFSKVTILNDVNIDDCITVSNSVKNSGNYYVKAGNSAKIELNDSINANGTTLKPKNGISCYRDTNTTNSSKFINTSNGTIGLKSSNTVTKIQFRTGWKSPVYQINGDINVFFDSKEPTISEINNIDYTNKEQVIEFDVVDPLEKYKDVEFCSGVENSAVSVTRKYKNASNIQVNESVAVDYDNTTGKYSFKAQPVLDLTCDVTYSITATDRVGNVSETKQVTVKNDTTAPVLSKIEFTNENDNVFARIINKISFGKWLSNKISATVTAEDLGAGFDNDNSVARIKLVPEGKTIDDVTAFSSAKINSEGKAVIEIPCDSEAYAEGVFKGTIYYQLSDKLGNTTDYLLATTANSNIGSNTDVVDIVMIEENKPTTLISLNDEYKNNSSTKLYQKDEDTLISNSNPTVDLTFSDTDSGLYGYEITVIGKEEKTITKTGMSVDLAEDDEKTASDTLKKYTYTLDLTDIVADSNGKYVIKSKSTDNSGNVSDEAEYTIYVDKTMPTITEFSFDIDNGKSSELKDEIDAMPYGFYFKTTVTVTITAQDTAGENEISSGIKSITYKAVDVDGTTKYEGTEAVDENNTVSFEIGPNFKGQIYAKATDNVENETDKYVHPDGSVVESSSKHSDTSGIEIVAPKTSYTQNNASKYSYAGDENAVKDADMDYVTSIGKGQVPLYGEDVTFGVTVEDTYSGISMVTYTIIEGGEQRGATTAISNDGSFEAESNGWTVPNDGRDENLVTKMTKNISVSGNYNDMVLLVELTDNAGNKSYDYYVFGIDKTAPSITVTYDNNDGDTKSGTGTYFKKNRTATIVVTERNFNTEDVKFTVKNAEGEAPAVIDKGCTKKDKTGNGDATQYTYKITYKNDGVYTFNVAYTDRANKKASVDTKDSVAPKAFVVDKTEPTINVSYSNNSAQNGKYFKADRTATITVKEHNFDVKRVIITQASSLSNKTIANPAVTWKNSGDIHTATIHYNANGDYKFDITMTDKAGNKEKNVNYGSSVAPKEFTVDKTCENIVTVTGIKDGEVLGKAEGKADSDDVKITIKIDDINIDNFNIKLARNRVIVDGESNNKDAEPGDNMDISKIETDEDVTNQFVKPSSGSENTTATISIPKKDKDGVKNDGLYTLKIEAKDKAGNAYDTNANIIVFSVNRYGSVYTFSDDLCSMITDNEGYTNADVKDLSNDITIYEYNPTDVKSQTVEIIRDNDTVNLVKDKDYTINTSKKKSKASWSRNAYTIFTDNFKQDGVYNIRVSSKDEAQIKSQTVDYDVCTAEFKIDRTKPEIVSVNYSPDIEKVTMKNEQATVESDKLTVNFAVEDLMRLDSVEIYVNDSNKPVTYTYNEKNSEFTDANFFDGCSFDLDMSSDVQNFRIVVKDKAGNITDTSDKKSFKPGYVFFDHITVSTNKLVIWSKSPLFWIIIAAVAVLAVAAIVLIAVKRRKKDDGEATESAE
ncbi:MAG: hypothetical protein ACI4IE_00790 [Eubacterium sp.]